MIRSMRAVRVLSFAVLLAAFASGIPAGAQDFGLDQGWKSAIEHNCDAWKGDTEYRCLSNGRFDNYQTQSVRIENKSDKTVTFDWSEYHSGCGSNSSRIEDHQFQVEPGKKNAINAYLLAPGTRITCREVFLHSCKQGSEPKHCPAVLTAVLRSWKGSAQ